MLQFLVKLALLLPLLIGMAWVNWSVDPAILFVEHRDDPARHPYENVVAEDLLAGHPHRLKTTYLELLVDELVFRNRPQIDTLVLGTSIAKPIHEGLFGGPNFFNASVTGGRIEEMLVAYQMALDCGLHPRHVLIEIDGRSLGQRVGQPASNTLQTAFKRLGIPIETRRDPILPMIWRALIPGDDVQGAAKEHGAFYPYDEIISPRYFQFTMAYVVRRWMAHTDKPREFVSQFGEANESLLYPDGSLEWWGNALAQTPETIRQKFDETHADSIAADEYRPVAEKCRLYEAFVADLVRSGIIVEFVLLPPNPWYFDRAEAAWTRAGKKLPSVETEAFIRALAAKYKLRVRGSIDPRRVGVTEADYIDDVHLRREAIDRVFKASNANGGQRQ
jgi:hypothetical protein